MAETREGKSAAEAKVIRLYGGIAFEEGKKRQFITKLDVSVQSLVECEQLSLSTNQIDRMFPLANMGKLKILSLSRNLIKKIEKLEEVAGTLEELWLSYNQIVSLDGLQGLAKLRVLYCSNNKIKDWSELDKLASLSALHDVLFVGNPIYEGMDRREAKLRVLKRVPQVLKIDGDVIVEADREAAAKLD